MSILIAGLLTGDNKMAKDQNNHFYNLNSYINEMSNFLTSGLDKIIRDGFIYDVLKKKRAFISCKDISNYTVTDATKQQIASLSVPQSTFLAARYVIALAFELQEKYDLTFDKTSAESELGLLSAICLEARIPVAVINDAFEHAYDTVISDKLKEYQQEMQIISAMSAKNRIKS